LLSNPNDYIAALSSLGSIFPDPSVSNKLNASLIYFYYLYFILLLFHLR